MKTTKLRIALWAILLIVLSALPALAADVTGTWTMEDKDPRDGSAVKAAYVFKQEGVKLTGTIEISVGNERPAIFTAKSTATRSPSPSLSATRRTPLAARLKETR
jgi:hypothetical protein